MKDYRKLTEDEVLQLKSQSCLADDWGNVLVAEGFNCEYVHHTRFSGEVKLGVFDAEFTPVSYTHLKMILPGALF